MEEVKKDKLEQIFLMQKAFDTELEKSRGLEDISMEKWLQMQTLAMISELAELLQEINFKWWKNPIEIKPDNVKEELCDILHFFIGMCIRAGLSADELFEKYCQKNKENFLRQQGKSMKKGYEI